MNFYFFFIMIFLFVFVVFHELAHSIVARHYGMRVRKIVLYPIGGVSEIEDLPDNPSQEWRMAVAGPLTSLVLGFTILAISLPFSQNLLPALIGLTITGNLPIDLAILNILLGLFNLIPAFPMDGGRVLRAALAQRIKYSDATRIAVIVGKIFGIAMVVVGFIFPNYFLLILIGLFVYLGAGEEGEQTKLYTKLADIQAKDIMQPNADMIDSTQPLTKALELMYKNRYHTVLVQKDGNFLGVVTWNEIMKIPAEQREYLRIEQIPLLNVSIFENQSILEAEKIQIRQKIDLLPVMQQENPTKVIGTLTREAITNAYENTKPITNNTK